MKANTTDWKSDLRRPQHGHTLLQMPMQTYMHRQWTAVFEERLSIATDVKSKPYTGAPSFATLRDKDTMLSLALSLHISRYGAVANTEAGLDLGIMPHDVVIDGGADGFVVVFVTIKSDACERLLDFDGVPELFDLVGKRRIKRLTSLNIHRQIPKDESLMDLMCAALPYTTRTVGSSSLREIADRAISLQRLQCGV